MDSNKKMGFVKMGRRHFAKGGAVRKLAKRKYFADGGSTQLYGPTNSGTQDSSTNPNTGFLGNISGGLGLNNNFEAQSANIQQGTNAAQLNSAYDQAQKGLDQQQGLVSTLTPQASTAVNNQNALANELYGMTQGEGPNPAKAELAEATNANNAQTASNMAGARGASGNVGLMARQSAQQGAKNQQDSAGQSATLQAQQQVAAQQNLANLSNNQISQTGQATTGLNSAGQNEQAILQNANTSANNANVGMQSNINNANSQTSAANQNMNSNVLGGIGSAASSVSSMFGAKGGEVTPKGFSNKDHHIKLAEMNAVALKHGMQHFDDGGDVEPNLGTFKAGDDSASAPSVAGGSALPSNTTDLSKSFGGGSKGGGGGGGGIASLAALALAEGGPIQANPLLGQPGINGPGAWTAGYFNAGNASSPNIEGSSSLPANKVDLSKKSDDKKKPNETPQYSPNQTDEEAKQGYLDADAALGTSEENGETEMPADNTNVGDQNIEMAAKGGTMGHFENYFSEGGDVPAMVSAGEIYLTPDKARQVVETGADPKSIGETFKGKAKVKGDSYANDTIPKTLEAGGIVIDRKNVGTREKRELFVHRHMARKKVK